MEYSGKLKDIFNSITLKRWRRYNKPLIGKINPKFRNTKEASTSYITYEKPLLSFSMYVKKMDS